MRLIDADALYKRTAEWEASALAYIDELNRTPLEEMTDEERAEWRRWTAILGERSAFKHDVADAPTADAVPVVRCKDCKHNSINRVSGNAFCDLGIGLSQIYDFCSKGERREDNGSLH